MTVPVYILECKSDGFSYEIRVNDMYAFSSSGGSESIVFSVNNLILVSGRQSLKVIMRRSSLLETSKPHLNIEINRYDIDLENEVYLVEPQTIVRLDYDIPSLPFIERSFNADVPFSLCMWKDSVNLNGRKDLSSLMVKAVQHYQSTILNGNYDAFIEGVMCHDRIVSESQYWRLSEVDIENRISELLEMLESGYVFSLPQGGEHLELYAYGQLARFVSPDGSPAMMLRNQTTGDELAMDIYFHLPKGEYIMKIV